MDHTNPGASNGSSMGDWRAAANRGGEQHEQQHTQTQQQQHTQTQQPTQPQQHRPEYVYTLGKHDVLLGRGTGPNNNNGNVEFRTAVEGCKIAYISTTSRKAKNAIVRNAVQSIKVQGGRFLNKLTKSNVKMRGLPNKAVYEIADDSVAVEKVKQALRYVCYKKEGTRIEIQSSRKRKKRPRSSSEDNQSQQSTEKQPSSQSASYNRSTTSNATSRSFLPNEAQQNAELKVHMADGNGNATAIMNGNGNMQRNMEPTNPAQVASLPPIGNGESSFAQLPPTTTRTPASHESLSNLSSASMMRYASATAAPVNPMLPNGQQRQRQQPELLTADRLAMESFLAAATERAAMAQPWQQQQQQVPQQQQQQQQQFLYPVPSVAVANPTAGLNGMTIPNYNNNNNNHANNNNNNQNNYYAVTNPLLQNPAFGQTMLVQPPIAAPVAVPPPQIDSQMLAGLLQGGGGNHGHLLALLMLQQQQQQGQDQNQQQQPNGQG